MNTIVFGSSFSDVFLPLESNKLKIMKFRGAMIKGLLDKNENYHIINETLKNNKYDNGIFMFGDPDCIFYFFKKKYVDNVDDKIIKENIMLNAAKYVEYVSNLKNITNIYICSVFPPNIISGDNFRKSMYIYRTFNEETCNRFLKKNFKYSNRLQIVLDFNDVLEKECKKHNIVFCNITKYLLNSKNKLSKIFRYPFNPCNVHLCFESVLIVYINKCFRFLIDNYKNVVEDIKIHNYNYIYESYIQYFKKNEIEKNKKIIVNLKDLVNVDKIEKIIRKIDKPKN
jgi:hypothetical protein